MGNAAQRGSPARIRLRSHTRALAASSERRWVQLSPAPTARSLFLVHGLILHPPSCSQPPFPRYQRQAPASLDAFKTKPKRFPTSPAFPQSPPSRAAQKPPMEQTWGWVWCLSPHTSNSFCWQSFIICTFTSRLRPVPKYIERRKAFSAIINEETFTARTESLKRSESSVSENSQSHICRGGDPPRAVSQSVSPRVHAPLKAGARKAALNPLLAAQTKPAHTKVAHLEKFQTIATGSSRGSREPGDKGCSIVKSAAEPQLLGDQDGPLFGLGEEDSCSQSHNLPQKMRVLLSWRGNNTGENPPATESPCCWSCASPAHRAEPSLPLPA